MSPARDKDSKSCVRALSRGGMMRYDKSHLSERNGKGGGALPRSPTSGSKENNVYCP